jgi:hypothetical protein
VLLRVRRQNCVERAGTQARRVIHDNDLERLKQLLAEYPALLSWQGDDDDGGLPGIATGAYGDSFDPDREQVFTRAACAELLIDAGAVVTPSVCRGIIESRARGLLQLFQRKGLLPRTLKFLAALGDVDAVRTALDENGTDLATVNEAFVCACRFKHEAVASVLLERSIALDPELGKHVDGRWNSHEPASILHHLVFYGSYESMQFLIDRGIDMTIKDYRWNSSAQGWARYGAKDEKMAQWLEERYLSADPV